MVASFTAAQIPSPPQPQSQQQQQQQPPPQNLQILPKDTTREQLLQTMQAFTQALGVQCSYCHVQEGGGGRTDMASDEKRTKLAARQMIVLARDINQKLPAAVNKPAEEATRVSCATCHRGVPIPRALADILTDTEKDQLVAFLEALTDPRVKDQSAPFDHPELFVPNGSPGDSSAVNCAYSTTCTEFIRVPQVGTNGRTAENLPPLGRFLDLDPHAH